jgi:hypothetical protein
MKRLAFPTLFVLMLIGFWVFSKAPGTAAGSSAQQQGKTATEQAAKPEALTDKEEIFAASLSPKNQEIFTKWMDRKQRTMAMEMIVENHRSGGSLSPDQVVEQLSKDFNLEQAHPAPVQPPAPVAPQQAKPAPSQGATTPSTGPSAGNTKAPTQPTK